MPSTEVNLARYEALIPHLVEAMRQSSRLAGTAADLAQPGRNAMNQPIDPKCQQVVELVSDYLDHVLTADDRLAFEKHLYTCPPCTAYLQQIQTLLRASGALGQKPPPEAVETELLGLFQRWQAKGPR